MARKVLCFVLLFFFVFSSREVNSQKKSPLNKYTFGGYEARHIGPATMSGRIAALDAVNNDPRIIYVGAASGGIWKSENAGTTFEPVFDDHIQSIGAIAVDQKHPDTVWAGTGEPWTRNSVSVGDGIYKTTDGGENWKNMGLEETERIGRIAINPENPDIVYVAAIGHLWGPNEERGVFRTTDGGKTWEKVLYINENTGCSDIALDPEDPDIIYAGMWNFRRKPHFFRSGGEGSGLYVSRDGGESWDRVDIDIATGMLGRVAVAVSPADPDIVWALIESEQTGLYRSADKGKTWELMNNEPVVGERPFYFAYLVADPADTNRIYKPGFTLNVSDDHGKTFTTPFINGGNIHVDLHAMYISNSNNNFIYLGTDGGLYISHDRGNTWKFCRNLPLSQFYRVSIDHNKNYNVYGGLQDNGSWYGPSESAGGIGNCDWENIGYGDGFNVLRDKKDPDIIYWQYQGGNIKRHYIDTREFKDIKPYTEESNEDLRFNWNTPLVQGASGAIYVGSQFLHRSTNFGDTWETISPDLTTNDPDKQNQENTGGLTIDNSTAENHCTIYWIGESPLNPEVIWVGTDDGNLQVTTDGGKSWKNITENIPGVPEATWVSWVEPSGHKEGTAYVTFDGHRSGDNDPYVFRTIDFGKTWESIASDDIPIYCHTIREDPVNPDLLFLGTEFGLYISIDQGEKWVRFSGNVPKVSVRQMQIHPETNDLVIGTHGRGIIILDDLTPIRALRSDMLEEELVFLGSGPFEPFSPGIQQRMEGDDGFTGSNPPGAVYITYYLSKRHLFGDMYIEIFDEEGELIKKMPAGKRKGINRVAWNMRRDPPKVPSSVQLLGGALVGPTYPPGDYTIKITKGDNTYDGAITIAWESESRHTIADRNLRQETLEKSYDLLEDLAYIDRQLIDIRDKATSIAGKTDNKSLKKDLLVTVDEMNSIRDEILATREGRITGQVRLRERLGDIYSGVMSYRGRPTDSQMERLRNLEREVEEYSGKLDRYKQKELASLNKMLEKENMGTIEIISREAFMSEN